MTKSKVKTVSFIFFILCCSLPATAPAFLGGPEDTFQAGGSVRSLAAVLDLRGPGGNVEGMEQSLLRTTLSWRPSEWMTWEVHAVESADFSSLNGTVVPSGLGQTGPGVRYQAGDWSWKQLTGQNVSALLWVDRSNVKCSLSWADLTVGRQAINFSKAYFWNPLDVFLPFDPRQFDREYKPGVDALRLDVPLGDLGGMNIVGASGRELTPQGGYKSGVNGYGSACLARLYSTWWGWDVAVQGGKLYGGVQSGGGLAGEIGPMELRSEVSYFSAMASDKIPLTDIPLLVDHWEAVAGTGHKFSKHLNIETEFLYNGASLPDDLTASASRWASGYSLQIGRVLGGVVISSEIHPLLNAQLGWIYSFTDGSSAIQTSFVYSVSDESDFLFGASINRGSRPGINALGMTTVGSEFGLQPDTVYGQYRFYF